MPLKVVASCLDTLQPVILEDFADAQDLETCLRASANVPEVSLRIKAHLLQVVVCSPVVTCVHSSEGYLGNIPLLHQDTWLGVVQRV